MIVFGPLLEAIGDAAPRFEAVDAPFDDIAAPIALAVDRTSGLGAPAGPAARSSAAAARYWPTPCP